MAVADQDYDIQRVAHALRRFWWIALLVPCAIFTILSIRNLTADYQSSFQASILLSGDTETPGSAERPELMILDDLDPVVSSLAFAEMVSASAGLRPEDVHGTIGSTRYSRVATITISSGSETRARQIANSAAQVFPNAVNSLMVADGGTPATVAILDPPSEPIRGDADKWTITFIATIVGLAVGCFLALVCDASLATIGQVSALRPRPESDSR